MRKRFQGDFSLSLLSEEPVLCDFAGEQRRRRELFAFRLQLRFPISRSRLLKVDKEDGALPVGLLLLLHLLGPSPPGGKLSDSDDSPQRIALCVHRVLLLGRGQVDHHALLQGGQGSRGTTLEYILSRKVFPLSIQQIFFDNIGQT